jgi:S1-C subfamily serine protease
VGVSFRKITHFCNMTEFNPGGKYFGRTPDLAFLVVDVRGLPALTIGDAADTLVMGKEVVTVGFPLGTLSLAPYGGLTQFHPFARRGIISSVIPYPSDKPHEFTVDILTEGGSSGSPICSCEDGSVVGLLYSSFDGVPITYGVPGHIVKSGLQCVLQQWKPNANLDSFEDVVSQIFSDESGPIEWERLC